MYLGKKNKTDKDQCSSNCSLSDSFGANNKQGYRDLVLNMLQDSPEVSKLLVQLHDHERLYSMAKSKDDKSRMELAQIIADLLQYNQNTTQHELIADVLMGIIEKAEINLKRALAERLSLIKGVPLRIVLNLANDEIDVADSILQKSEDLKDFDLIYIMKAKGVEHSRSIAQRPKISEQLIDLLAEQEDMIVAVNLANNESITITPRSMKILTNMSMRSEELARPFIQRSDIDVSCVKKIYEFVGEELKHYIRDNFSSEDMSVIGSEINELVKEFGNSEDEITSPPENLITKAQDMLKANILSPTVMVDNLRRGQIANFSAQMSVYCDISVEQVDLIIKDKTGLKMVAACKLADIQKSDFVNMYLLTSRVRGARMISETSLSKVMRSFDRIDKPMAQKILRSDLH